MYFVISALLSIAMLRRADSVENGYVRNTPVELLQELQALIDAATDLLPPAIDQGVGPMVVTIPATTKTPKAAKKSSKKAAAPATT
jgi:hypothetical protein